MSPKLIVAALMSVAFAVVPLLAYDCATCTTGCHMITMEFDVTLQTSVEYDPYYGKSVRVPNPDGGVVKTSQLSYKFRHWPTGTPICCAPNTKNCLGAGSGKMPTWSAPIPSRPWCDLGWNTP